MSKRLTLSVPDRREIWIREGLEKVANMNTILPFKTQFKFGNFTKYPSHIDFFCKEQIIGQGQLIDIYISIGKDQC